MPTTVLGARDTVVNKIEGSSLWFSYFYVFTYLSITVCSDGKRGNHGCICGNALPSFFGEISYLPSFFPPSTNIYQMPAMPATGDTKIKSYMLPSVTLQWRKQKVKQAIGNSVLGAHAITSIFEVIEVFLFYFIVYLREMCRLRLEEKAGVSQIRRWGSGERIFLADRTACLRTRTFFRVAGVYRL